MSEVNMQSAIEEIQKNVDRQRYRPKQLIFIVRKGPKNRALSERQQILFERLKHLIELDLMSTELIATEGRRTAMDRNFFQDTIDGYSQEFKFSERTDKLIYNQFREMRATDVLQLADVEILIIEPGQDYLTAADAWLFQDLSLLRIRNAHAPQRDYTKVVERDPEGNDHENFTTTIALYGRLWHPFELMESANFELSRMQLVSLNPNEHPAFLGAHSVAVESPADPTSTAHCDAAARL